MKASKISLNYWLFRYRDSGLITEQERINIWAQVKSGAIDTLPKLAWALNEKN